jgi:Ankyrin repeats (many copies)
MEPIFGAVLANDPSRIAAAEAGTPGAAKLRMDEDLLVTELPHMLYRGDTPLHLAAAGLRYDAARALLAAGSPVNAVNRRGATALHYACDARPLAPTWDPAVQLLLAAGATMADTDRNGVAVADRIQSQALRDALAG